MENNFNTKDCITAVQHYADEHGKEDAYQSATWLFKAQIITQEQWSAMVHALYDDDPSAPA